MYLPFLRRKPITHAQHGVAAEGQYSTPFICSPTLILRFSKVTTGLLQFQWLKMMQ